MYFMAEGTGDKTVSYFCKPYQRLQFGGDKQDATEYRPIIGIMHRYPRVLALGMTLIELGTGRSILRRY
jgi:hypothetical protein